MAPTWAGWNTPDSNSVSAVMSGDSSSRSSNVDQLKGELEALKKEVKANQEKKAETLVEVTTMLLASDRAMRKSILEVTNQVKAMQETKESALIELTKVIAAKDAALRQSIQEVQKEVKANKEKKEEALFDLKKILLAKDAAMRQSILEVQKEVKANKGTKEAALVDLKKIIVAKDLAVRKSILEVQKEVKANKETKEAALVDLKKIIVAKDLAVRKSIQEVQKEVKANKETKEDALVHLKKILTAQDAALRQAITANADTVAKVRKQMESRVESAFTNLNETIFTMNGVVLEVKKQGERNHATYKAGFLDLKNATTVLDRMATSLVTQNFDTQSQLRAAQKAYNTKLDKGVAELKAGIRNNGYAGDTAFEKNSHRLDYVDRQHREVLKRLKDLLNAVG